MSDITAEEAAGPCPLCGQLRITYPDAPEVDLPFLTRAIMPDVSPLAAVVHTACLRGYYGPVLPARDPD